MSISNENFLSPSPMSNSIIPWPNSGNRKPRQLFKATLKTSKLSTKLAKFEHISPKNSSLCSSSTSSQIDRRNSGQIFNQLFRERAKTAFKNSDSTSSVEIIRSKSGNDLLPKVYSDDVRSSKPCKSLFDEKPQPAKKIDISGIDTSPEPLCKKLIYLKTSNDNEKGSLPGFISKSNNFKTSSHLSRETPELKSVTKSKKVLDFLSSSDEEILPLSERILKTTNDNEKGSLPGLISKSNKFRTPSHLSRETPGLKSVTKSEKVLDFLSSSDEEILPLSKRILKKNGPPSNKISDTPFNVLQISSSDSDSLDEILNTRKKLKKRILIISSDSSESSYDTKRISSKKPSKNFTEPKKHATIILPDIKNTPISTLNFDNEKTPERKTIPKTPVTNFHKKNSGTPKTPTSKALEIDRKEANHFIESMNENFPVDKMHIDAVRYVKHFSKCKEDLTYFLYGLYNKHVFDNKLPRKMVITWKARLTKTAGFCTYRNRIFPSNPNISAIRTASIDLSTKVLDSPYRLRNTLIHEMCHAATWIINNIKDAHHGREWINWGLLAVHRLPAIPMITRTHNYEITAKYVYKCTKCKATVKRHSKSLDMTRKVCGICRAPFELLVNGKLVASSVTQVEKQSLTPFAKFVKDNYANVRKVNNDKHFEVMKKLGKLFAQQATIN